jgi:hypothetical protein
MKKLIFVYGKFLKILVGSVFWQRKKRNRKGWECETRGVFLKITLAFS